MILVMETATKPKKARNLWNHDRLVALLAWVDFCIEHKLDFKATILKQLSGISGIFPTEFFRVPCRKCFRSLAISGGAMTKSMPKMISLREALSTGKECLQIYRETLKMHYNGTQRVNSRQSIAAKVLNTISTILHQSYSTKTR
tara:strand:+ start:1119 stop:1550 length:432 start_codon:yes stop_codon:yes gene_type:complete